MGCDIHLEIERKAPGEDFWRPIDWRIVECWACKGTGVNQPWPHHERPDTGGPCRDCAVMPAVYDYGLRNWIAQPGKRRERWLYWRNYSQFAILANVRNGYGFAGVDTGDGFRPISEPRGLPEDKAYYPDDDDWRFGDHSFSWLAIEEVLGYDWAQTTVRRGWVNYEQFKVWESEGMPETWSGMIAGPSIKHVTNEEMRLLREPDENTYTQVAWTRTYSEEFGLENLAALKELRANTDGELRLVFGFDS